MARLTVSTAIPANDVAGTLELQATAITGERRAARAAYGLLLGLWLFHTVANAIWLKVDTRPPYWDMAAQAITTVRFGQWLSTPNLPAALSGLLTDSVYPPLLNWISAPLGLLIWPTADVFCGVQVLFLGILFLSTYHLGVHFGGRRVGLLAAGLVSMYPLLYGLSRHYLSDIALVSMVTLSIWMLVRTDGFGRRDASAWYGLTLGLGLLTKWAFVIFAGGPLIVASLSALRARSRTRVTNMGLALLVGAVVAAPWYVVNLRSTLEFFRRASIFAAAEGDPSVASLASWSYYLEALARDQALLPLTLFFALALVLWLVHPRARGETALLGTWIIVAYLLSSLFYNKDVRYTLPYLPAIAVITARGLCLVRSARLRHGLLALLVLYVTLQFVGATWGLSRAFPARMLPDYVGVRVGTTRWPVYAEAVHIASPPVAEVWPVAMILQDVVSAGPVRSGSGPIIVAVLPDMPYFENNVFKYYAIVGELPVQASPVAGVSAIPDARVGLMASDYVVAKTGDQGPVWTAQQAGVLTAELHLRSSELGRRFELMRQYPLPDGSTAELYRQRP